MPINITQGNTAEFTVEFISSTGAAVTPSSANMNVSYTSSLNVPSIDVVQLTLANSIFSGTWGSSGTQLGLVNCTASTLASSNVFSTQLRIIA